MAAALDSSEYNFEFHENVFPFQSENVKGIDGRAKSLLFRSTKYTGMSKISKKADGF